MRLLVKFICAVCIRRLGSPQLSWPFSQQPRTGSATGKQSDGRVLLDVDRLLFWALFRVGLAVRPAWSATMNIVYLVSGILAVLLFGYLLVALLMPEWFS
jgi:K+-transporting ATPase KdpF subunit